MFCLLPRQFCDCRVGRRVYICYPPLLPPPSPYRKRGGHLGAAASRGAEGGGRQPCLFLHCIIGVSYKRTEAIVYEVIPQDKINDCYMHASPDCTGGSTANRNSRNLKLCIKNTRWILLLFRRMKPKFWTLEQITLIGLCTK